MSASRAQREFTASLYKTFEHYVRSGGRLGDVEKNFFTIDDGNMKILAPKSMWKEGIEETLSRKTYDLMMEARDMENPVKRSTWLNVYGNGQWVFDGVDGFALMDAATGLNALDGRGNPARVGIGDVHSLNPSQYGEEE
jgi:hypothetical protein